MKITIDTDKIAEKFGTAATTANSVINQKISKYTDREVLFICMTAILTVYIIGDYLDNRRIGQVEVTLEKVQDDIRQMKGEVEVTLEKDENNTRIESKGILPRTKYPQLFNTGKKVNLTQAEFNCLAKNIYFEAKFEPYIGKIAIANVTYNRLMQKKWGDDVCKIVYAKKQFSWTLFKKMRNEIPSGKHWVAAKHAAMMFTRGVRVTNLNTTDHYFADYIKPPKWSREMFKDAKIGKHIFFTASN
jgi:spore germination cell wall hydrolase CwlJ-like protein